MAIESNMLRRLRGIAAGGREECPRGCGALLHIEILHDASKRSEVERASCAKCSFAEDREPLSPAKAVGILLQALDEAERKG